MLRRLTVDNYALIEHLEMVLGNGLNIITGETGAGKSILLGALGLLLGNKNDGSALKDATRNCIIEAQFDIENLNLESFFDENDLDYEPHCIIRRIITPAGKSRSFINDMPCQLSTLKELGSRLIDIHSQHQNLILSSEEFRIRSLDTLSDNASLLEEYSAAYAEVGRAHRALTELREMTSAARRDEEWLRFQTEELVAAELREGEMEELEQEQAVLADADRIGETLAAVRNALDEEQTGVLVRLRSAEIDLSHIRESYPSAVEAAERIRTALLDLKDLGATIASDSERIASDPERLQKVDDRLNMLYTLIRKHRVADHRELISLRDRCVAQLASIEHSDEALRQAEQALADATTRAMSLATDIHNSRSATAPQFEQEIISTLSLLGMPDTRFEVCITATDSLLASGCDEVTFLFSANRGAAMQPIEKIASGGEISRVMLAMKSLLARRMQLPTIIFDEIDTGVSGRIADSMGSIISQLSDAMQVIDITHLPQVASKGKSHFVVYKRDGRTDIRLLSAEERITEIAKMLSGSEITAAAIEQAKHLIDN